MYVPFLAAEVTLNDQDLVLIVDDEHPVRRVLATLLEAEGFDVLEAANGRECMQLAYQHHPDLVLLDILMPGRDGREVTRQLRDLSPDLPIIMLTALSDQAEIVARLCDGADDYIAKPFQAQELLARIRAVLRRSNRRRRPSVQAYQDSQLNIDFQAHRLTIRGDAVSLSPKEWRLLEYLVEHKDKALTRAELLRHVWGSGYEKEHRYLKVFVSHLRQKLGEPSHSPRYIHTLREEG
jgi:DNA-binding response OmpR family regulator